MHDNEIRSEILKNPAGREDEQSGTNTFAERARHLPGFAEGWSARRWRLIAKALAVVSGFWALLVLGGVMSGGPIAGLVILAALFGAPAIYAYRQARMASGREFWASELAGASADAIADLHAQLQKALDDLHAGEALVRGSVVSFSINADRTELTIAAKPDGYHPSGTATVRLLPLEDGGFVRVGRVLQPALSFYEKLATEQLLEALDRHLPIAEVTAVGAMRFLIE